MRSKYPLSSMEINDIVFRAYENVVHLLSYQNSSGVVSGVLDVLDDQASNSFISGVLSLNDINDDVGGTDFGQLSGYMDISEFLKTDYMYRKYYETEV